MLILLASAFPSVKAQIYEQPSTGSIGIGTTTIDNAQTWRRVLQLNANDHAKFLVTTTGGVKVGVFSHDGYNGKIGTESAHNLTFTAGYWNDVMTLTTGGNVGIGTLNPSAKLAVDGNIKAREVKVENTVWPDYVFEGSYQLPTLKETEHYIKENGHLPGIPSAADVKANGIELGDMNARLLKKIEEMTLLFIEEHKRNTETQQLLKEQRDMIKALSERLRHVENANNKKTS
ncbi:hypothetical protein SAMN05421820_10853 [Pedobacter steynii]|uniref:BZIP transcription factor n=2 Tax=Pedobacter steynii TaxID=430522 RepID=A0A1H0C998_9SPHI|nr:hypothetical protein SAMN05421820_10853 [Pedobacter steynii]